MTKTNQWHRFTTILMGVFLAALLLVHYAYPTKDSDIFFHLKYGEHFVHQKTLVMDHSIFSWTPATSYHTYCTWAADVFYYLLFQLGEWPLLFIFKHVCLFGTVAAGWIIALRSGVGSKLIVFFTLTILSLAIAGAGWIKPEIISNVLFTLLGFIYFSAKAGQANLRRRRLFWLYPPLFLVWVNVHGVVFFGLLLLTAVIAGETINYLIKSQHAFTRNELSTLMVTGGLSVAATFLNPYGADLHRSFFNFSTQGMPLSVETNIRAYQSLIGSFSNLMSAQLVLYGCIMAIGLMGLIITQGRKNHDWDFGILIPNVLLGALFFYFNRSTHYWPPFWAMSVFFLSGKYCLDASSMLMQTKPLIRRPFVGLLMALPLFGALIAVYFDYYIPKPGSYFGWGISQREPVQESAFLKNNPLGTRLFNTYNTGCYLLYDLYPRYKVFIDARYFPYRKSIYETSAAFANGRMPLSAMEAEYEFDVAVVEHASRELYQFIGAKHWRAAFYGIGGVVFVKDSIALLPNLTQPDKHRFDNLKNLTQTMDVMITAHNLNDLDTAAYILSIMKRNMGHLYGYQDYYNYLTACQKGLEAYAQGDTDTAFNLFWGIGFTNRQLRMNLYLRIMVNDNVGMLVNKGHYGDALRLLKPVLQNYPQHADILYDTAIVTYLASGKDHSAAPVMGLQWDVLLKQMLRVAPDHAYAPIAHQLLANQDLDPLPLVLNRRMQARRPSRK